MTVSEWKTEEYAIMKKAKEKLIKERGEGAVRREHVLLTSNTWGYVIQRNRNGSVEVMSMDNAGRLFFEWGTIAYSEGYEPMLFY